MVKIKKMAIVCALLICLLPATSVLADDAVEVTTGDDYTVGVTDGSTKTGNTSGGTTVTEGGSGSGTSSSLTEEEKLAIQIQTHNREVTKKITDIAQGIIRDADGNVIGIQTPSGIIYIKDFTITKEQLQDLVNNANYLRQVTSSPEGALAPTTCDPAYLLDFYKLITGSLSGENTGAFSEPIQKPLYSDISPNPVSMPWVPNYPVPDPSTGLYPIRNDIGPIYDAPEFIDRYTQINTYLQGITSKDTIDVQYIIEYRFENVKQTEITQVEPISGLYTWNVYKSDEKGTIEDESVSYLNFTIPETVVQNPIREAGWFVINCSTQAIVHTVDALQYSVYEYWVVKDTGQVIWKQSSTGSIGAYDTDSNSREGDVKVGYINQTVLPPQSIFLPFAESTPTINEDRTRCLIHVSDANIGTGYLSTGGLSNDTWTTKRIS